VDADLLANAISIIDATNADDPNTFEGEPLAQAQGRRAHEWVLHLDPESGPALQLAARAHHLERWALARADYAEGRDGYLRWRRDQKRAHAERLTELLTPLDIEPTEITRATEIIQKKGLGSDPEVQVFEDAVCLTFIETQFRTTADKIGDDDKMVEVVAKTLRKMSDSGIAASGSIALDPRSAEIVRRATAALG
jgi:hypothetical protein